MELKNYLIDLLSNIIHDRLQMLSDIKKEMQKTESYKKIEEIFSDVSNVVNVSNDELRMVLSDIVDEETISGIISNVDMIKIVQKGINDGFDLSLDESQENLIQGVYEIVNNFRLELEEKNKGTKEYLEDFISKCESLSGEIGTGVVRSIDVLDEILSNNDVSKDDIVKSKYEILINNNKNFNLNLDGKVKEEVDLRIVLKDASLDIDVYNDIQKKLLINYANISDVKEMLECLSLNNVTLSSYDLFIVLMFSNVSIVKEIIGLCANYCIDFSLLFKMPGVFISKNNIIKQVFDENRSEDLSSIANIEFIDGCYEIFLDNVSLLEANNRSVCECFSGNMLSLIVPDMAKNIAILHDVDLSNKDFSVVVMNPFLATSIASFNDCGLSDYIKNNPLRLCTSYYRLKIISSNIVKARKNGQIIFRSLSDKKSYWLAKNITSSEVI